MPSSAPLPPPGGGGDGRRKRPSWAQLLLAAGLALAWTDGARAQAPALHHLPRRALLETTTTAAGDAATPSTSAAPASPIVALSGGRQPTPPGRCKVLALPCVASVLGQAGAGPCSGPASFDRDNTCCPIVRDFVQAGCACDGPFLAIASFGGWNGEKLAQAVRTILSTPCGKGLKDETCLLTCPPRAPQPK